MNGIKWQRWLVAAAAMFMPSGFVEGQDSASALRAAFQNPPAEFRPVVITHGKALADPGLPDWLEALHAGGTVLDGSVPKAGTPGGEPWNDPTYLDDPQAFDRLRSAVDELHRRGRTIWIYDELGYPSGSAGGRVLQEHPEFQAWAVGCRDFQPVDGRVTISPDAGHVVACFALPRTNKALALDDAIDLTDQARSGSFTWKALDGDWLVCLFERYQPDTWRRHNIPRRNVNILDRRAIARFIELTHARYARELGSRLNDVTLFFTDEPQFGATEPWMYGAKEAVPAVQWCDELPQAFQRKTGYSVTRALPALFHDVGAETSRLRYDFYDVQSDLVAENYFGQLEDWCHRHDVWSSGHMLLEESLLLHLMWSGSMVKNWSRMDLPGVDLLGLPRYKTMAGWNGDAVPVSEDYSSKLAASIAHLTGKPGVFTESYAVAANATLRPVLGIAAWQYATGVTHMSTYTIQNQLSVKDYAAFADFAGRLALLCRRGKPVSDVAVLVPEASVWAAYRPPDGGLFPRYLKCNPTAVHIDHVFRETCHQLLAHQRDFEILSENLLQQAIIGDGQFELSGQRFSFLLLPEMRMLSDATWHTVVAFVKSGGYVAFVGSLPCQNPQRGDDPDRRRNAEALLASAQECTRHVTETENIGELVSWMNDRVPSPVPWQGPSCVRIMRRLETDRDILLVANPSAEDVLGELTTPSPGVVSLWDPETGMVSILAERQADRTVSVRVPADSARFVVVEEK